MTKVKLSEIKLGPVREAVLPEGFILRVQKFKEILKEVETNSLEEIINSFQRDLHPENEIIIWEHIAYLYEKKTSNASYNLLEKKKIFRDLLMASLGG